MAEWNFNYWKSEPDGARHDTSYHRATGGGVAHDQDESGDVRVASTTDTERVVNEVANDEWVQEQDYSSSRDDRKVTDFRAALTPARLEANLENFAIAMQAEKTRHPDIEGILSEEAQLPDYVGATIVSDLVTNGAKIAVYLGQHPKVLQRLSEMTPKQRIAHVIDLDIKLQTDPLFDDEQPYQDWRKSRDAQIASRYK